MFNSSDVDKWTKNKCIEFLKTVKGAKVSGNKNELISRVKGYVEHPEILKSIQDAPEATFSTSLDINSIDENLLSWSSSKQCLPSVTVTTLESYVTTQKQAAQAMQEKGYRVFASRKILSIQTAELGSSKLLLKAFVRPSMEGKPARPLWICFVDNKPTQAFCRCPAGKSGLCCHVSATLYALEEYNRTCNLTLELPCTSKLQTWHKNKPWRGSITKIENIKVESAKKKTKTPKKRDCRTIAKKVEHTLSNLSIYSNAEREQRLLNCMNTTSTTKSAIWNVLNHRYPSNVLDHQNQITQQPTTSTPAKASSENVTNQMVHIEEITRGQRNNPLWHKYRQYRVTASSARKLLHSTEVGRPALINKIMNLQLLQDEENIPPAMLYGIKNEENARQKFVKLTGHTVQECGCFVDGILLASPDGYIPKTDHLLEIKGLSSQRSQRVIEAIKEKQNLKSYPYALTADGKPYLKKENVRGYYEQVQMQMGLSGKSVVDFVVFSDIDLEYFSIPFDEAFFLELKVNLQQWHKTYISPLLTSEKCHKLL